MVKLPSPKGEGVGGEVSMMYQTVVLLLSFIGSQSRFFVGIALLYIYSLWSNVIASL
jgi:hypothetical protein